MLADHFRWLLNFKLFKSPIATTWESWWRDAIHDKHIKRHAERTCGHVAFWYSLCMCLSKSCLRKHLHAPHVGFGFFCCIEWDFKQRTDWRLLNCYGSFAGIDLGCDIPKMEVFNCFETISKVLLLEVYTFIKFLSSHTFPLWTMLDLTFAYICNLESVYTEYNFIRTSCLTSPNLSEKTIHAKSLEYPTRFQKCSEVSTEHENAYMVWVIGDSTTVKLNWGFLKSHGWITFN